MVWGLCMPSTFGKFFPGGVYEQGDEPGSSMYERRLNWYYHGLPDDEMRALFTPDENHSNYSDFVKEKLNSEDSSRYLLDLPPLAPRKSIMPHEPPRSFDIQRLYSTLGDLIKMNSRILAVSESLKEAIENLEPGKHQFFPITVTLPIIGEVEKKFYTFVVGQYLDSFMPSFSEESSYNKYDDRDLYRFESGSAGLGGLAVATEVIGGAHLWSERRFTNHLICLSDELKAAITYAGLAIPKHYRMREV